MILLAILQTPRAVCMWIWWLDLRLCLQPSLSLKEKGHIACCLEEIGSMRTAAFHLLCINSLFNGWMMT
jgi:hypothetical protein